MTAGLLYNDVKKYSTILQPNVKQMDALVNFAFTKKTKKTLNWTSVRLVGVAGTEPLLRICITKPYASTKQE